MADKQAKFTKVITGWKLNKGVIAEKAGMNPYTFKMKLAGKPTYHFTDEEKERIVQVLRDLVKEINTIK